MKRYSAQLFVVTLLAGATLLSCGAVRIETGASQEETTASNSDRASQYKRDWVSIFNSYGLKEQISFLQRHVDSTAAKYQDFGESIVAQWREGTEGRGRAISDEEMRVIVDKWIATQKPYLTANDDILEYGITRLKERPDMFSDIIPAIEELAGRYYDCSGAIFYPSGTVEQFENRIIENISRLQESSEKLNRLLESR